MFGKIWRLLKTSPQDSNHPLLPMDVPPTLTDVDQDEGEEEVDREAKAWYDRGEEQYDLGNFQGARSSYDKALEFKPDYHESWNNRGIALDDLGRLKEARSSYDKT